MAHLSKPYPLLDQLVTEHTPLGSVTVLLSIVGDREMYGLHPDHIGALTTAVDDVAFYVATAVDDHSQETGRLVPLPPYSIAV